MSTREEIERAKAAGSLVPFVPALRWVPTPRAFLLSQRLRSEIDAGISSAEETERARWDKLEADISHFVEGNFVDWSLLKWLDPRKFEHWTLRSVRPRPSLRVFGRFAEPDVFVGTHVMRRDLLKGKNSFEWEYERLICEDVWNSVNLGEPFSAKSYEAYITTNARRNLKVLS